MTLTSLRGEWVAFGYLVSYGIFFYHLGSWLQVVIDCGHEKSETKKIYRLNSATAFSDHVSQALNPYIALLGVGSVLLGSVRA